MTFSDKLPGCRELLSLCQEYPYPSSVDMDDDSSASTTSSSSFEDGRRTRSARLNTKPYADSASLTRSIKSRKRKDTFDREEQRKAKLENDPWSDPTRLTPKSVFCLGCKRSIRLDRRNDYYPGLWLKHRGLCHGIARAKKESPTRKLNITLKVQKREDTKPCIDDETAAQILTEMMFRGRCFSDASSDAASSYSSS